MADLSKINSGSVVVSYVYARVRNGPAFHKFQLIKLSNDWLRWEYCRICAKVRTIPDWVTKALESVPKIPVNNYDPSRAKLIIRNHLDKQYDLRSK